MITLNHILPDRNGIDFTSRFKENKKIAAKFVDTYTGLCLWGTEMEVFPGGSYFVSYPRTTQLITFLIEEIDSWKILLKICDFSSELSHSSEKLDSLNLLENIGGEISQKDLWSGLALYEIFFEKSYDHEHCKIDPGDVVVDIGANIGLFSYYSILGGASKVHSFEPDPELSNLIHENFRNIPIEVNNLAVWSEKKNLELNIGEISIYNSVYFSPKETKKIIPCEGVVLQEWAEQNHIKIDFLKIDCEGCEWEILPTMSPEFLRSISKIVLEYHIHPPDQLLLIFSENGFQTHHTGNMIWAWQNKKILS